MNIRNVTMACVVALASIQAAAQTIETYDFTMRLKVPRVYDNMQSLGYRKYQWQTLCGQLDVVYDSADGTTYARIVGLYNRTHKVGGSSIVYNCYEWPYDDSPVRVVAVGNNLTGKFTAGGMEFSFVADPSYNIGGVEEDNTLMLELSGVGNIRNGHFTTVVGAVKGRIGCGCYAYGHTSPTRKWFGYLTSVVVDIAPLYGTFKARFKSRRVGPYALD